MEEPKLSPQLFAMPLHWVPQFLVFRVVVDDEDLEVAISLVGKRVKSTVDNVRWLCIAGHMDRDFEFGENILPTVLWSRPPDSTQHLLSQVAAKEIHGSEDDRGDGKHPQRKSSKTIYLGNCGKAGQPE
jgi:hypothetical protein